jgi:glycosyltransferase involved in cell wall biosynthesis
MPKVSVIIPCFNQGAFLDEAVDSVLAQTFVDLEIIVVNDGSTDALTRHKLNTYRRDKTRVVTTDNQGLAAARNNGIAAAAGDYILPLDADDRIAPRYIEEAVAVLEAEPDTGIVYCQARLFGVVEADWLLPPYSIDEMLRDNVIFCSALFRRADWELVGGYDTGMVYGWEDYEFWLSLIERGRAVRRLDGRYFCYRVAADSMVRSKEKKQKLAMFKRIYQRHTAFISEHIEVWLAPLLEARESYHTARLYVDQGDGLSNDGSIARKVNRGRQVLTFPVETFAQQRAFRFDPADCPVIVELISVEADTGQGRSGVDITLVGANALYRQGNLFYFDTADPQIILPAVIAGDGGVVRSIVITLNLLALGEAALHRIVDYQHEQLLRPSCRSMLAKMIPFRKRDGRT